LNIATDFYASHSELIEHVLFIGEVRDRQELMELYRDAKIFAFPSRWETFGIVLTEAMMQGCFPVVTRIDTNQYLTGSYKFALSSDVDDIDGLAQNLLHACTHEEETERLALEAMNITRQRLDLRRCCDAIEAELH